MSALVDLANLDLASTPNHLPPPPPPPAAPPAAIPTAQRARTLDGIHTDVVVQLFHDRVLVLVTQLGRIGAMIQVTPPPSTLPSLPAPPSSRPPSSSPSLASFPTPHPSTLLTPLFGAAPTPHISALHDLYALHVGALVFRRLGAGPDEGGAGGGRPVVLGIGLRRVKTEGGDGDEEEDAGVSEAEKRTFELVLDMVGECLG